MEINITDYLDHQEIKEIVEDELRNQIRNFFSGNEKMHRDYYRIYLMPLYQKKLRK